MNSHVTVEISRLGEAEQAEFTLIGLLAGMNPHVLGERRRVGEGLLTHTATIRPLT